MEKKVYIMPETEVYLIKSGNICDMGLHNSGDDGSQLSKDAGWETDWEDEENED